MESWLSLSKAVSLRLFLYVGQLNECKHVVSTIEAIAKFNCRFVFVSFVNSRTGERTVNIFGAAIPVGRHRPRAK